MTQSSARTSGTQFRLCCGFGHKRRLKVDYKWIAGGNANGVMPIIATAQQYRLAVQNTDYERAATSSFSKKVTKNVTENAKNSNS